MHMNVREIEVVVVREMGLAEDDPYPQVSFNPLVLVTHKNNKNI